MIVDAEQAATAINLKSVGSASCPDLADQDKIDPGKIVKNVYAR